MSDTSAPIASQWAHIRSGNTETLKVAYKDLETALDLPSPFVQLTLLNLGFLDIKNQNYDKAIARIEAALLLSISPRELGAAYLRLCLPEYRLGFRDYWEQHPANVIEASYVNLGYALLKSNRHKEAQDTLMEGLELMPSSLYLRHALARLHLFKKDAPGLFPI